MIVVESFYGGYGISVLVLIVMNTGNLILSPSHAIGCLLARSFAVRYVNNLVRCRLKSLCVEDAGLNFILSFEPQHL